MINDTIKKLTSLSLSALVITASGAISAFAYEADLNEENKTLLCETVDVPKNNKKETADSPFKNIANITKLPKIGDVDDDGKTTSNDSLIILRAAVGLHGEYTNRYYAGDVDGDNMITSADALCILRKSVGLNQHFANEPLNDVQWFKDSENYFAKNSNNKPLNGIEIIDGYKCGFDKEGRLLTGKNNINEKEYSFSENGVLIDGWQYTNEGKSYYRDGIKLDGWNNVYGLEYYFQDGYAVMGWNEIGGFKSYFDANGIASKGWKQINGKYFYFDNDYRVQSGLVTIHERKYYLYEDGDYALGWKTINGKNYYFIKTGAAALEFTEINGDTFFFIDENTLAQGFLEKNNLIYYFNEDYVMQTGWQTIDDKKYYFTENGQAVVGTCTIDGMNYEFDINGVMQNGWIECNKYKIFIDKNEIVTGEYTIDGVKYNFNANGYLITGLHKKYNKLYYNDEFGYTVTGWQIIDDNCYYFNSAGEGVDGFQLIDEKWYHFENGKLKNIDVFSQHDSRWADHPYGYYNTYGTEKATISTSGCGILSYVNAIYYLTGNFIEPTMLADWSIANGHRINGIGTAFSLYGSFAGVYGSQYGFRYIGQVSSYTELKNHLINGGTAVASAPGHLMAVVDYNPITEEFLILDSASYETRHTKDTGYTWQTESGIINTPLLNYSTFMLFSSTKF